MFDHFEGLALRGILLTHEETHLNLLMFIKDEFHVFLISEK